jgi:preprotein translocase subunit SecB
MQENNTAKAPTLQIMSQYIKDLSLEAPETPFILEKLSTPPALNVNIDIQVNKSPDGKAYTVELVTKVSAVKSDDQKTIFICELTYGALVTINATEEHIEPLLLVEVPHLLFPSVRSIMATITREAGLPPLQINPINFAKLYIDRVNQNKAGKQES